MEFTVLRNFIDEALGILERICSKSSSLPILNNILLAGEKNSISLCATDLQVGVTYTCLATVKKEGRTVIAPKILSPLVSLLSEHKVLFRAYEEGLLVESGEYHTKIKTLNPEDFPIIPGITGEEECIEVETKTFCGGLNQVVNMAGQSQVRPEISGIFFEFEKGTLRLAATDSFRLAEKTLTFQISNTIDRRFILPQKTAKELIDILGERSGKTKIYFSSNQTVFEYVPEDPSTQPHIQVVSRLIEGEYPHYQEVIPKTTKTKIIVRKSELVNHLRAASIFSGKTGEVRVRFDPKEKHVEVFAQSGDAGESRSLLKGHVEGVPLEVVFNWRFLGEGLAHMKGEDVELAISSEEGPALLHSVEQDGYVYVVMPIKS